MSILEHFHLKPHRDLKYTLFVIFLLSVYNYTGKDLSQQWSFPAIFTVTSVTFVLIEHVTILQFLMSSGTILSSQHWYSNTSIRILSNSGAFLVCKLLIVLLISLAVSNMLISSMIGRHSMVYNRVICHFSLSKT